MKKLLALIFVVVIVLSLVACRNNATEKKKTVKVGVSIYEFNNNFMTLYRNEIKKYFEEINEKGDVEYDVMIMDGRNDQAEQTNQINSFIIQGMDVLILNLVQSSSATTVMDQCAENEIPVIFINREPSESDMKLHNIGNFAGKYTYVGADARQSGKLQGELIAELPNKGDINGDGKLQYIMIEGDPENIDSKYRTQFSIEQYKATSGLDVECLDDQVGMWEQSKGQEIAANALAQYGDKIECIFCNNDAMALGAKEAIINAGRTCGKDIYLVGVDAIADAVDSVIDRTMTGTVLNDHIGQSHEAVDSAIKAVNGEKLELYSWIDYVKVTRDTLLQNK